MAKKTTEQKATLAMEHIRMFTHFKLSVLEAQCGIPSNYLCKQLKGTEIMKDKHYEELYDYLKKTAFAG